MIGGENGTAVLCAAASTVGSARRGRKWWESMAAQARIGRIREEGSFIAVVGLRVRLIYALG
jgi:hypothetical protein